jgi:hypothetical protein
MTKGEWSRCSDPVAMLRAIQDRASPRKLRLFAVACCRRVQDLVTHDNSRFAVLAAERFADGLVEAETLKAAHEMALRMTDTDPGYDTPEILAQRAAAHAARPTLHWVFPEVPAGGLADARRCAELAVGFRKLRQTGQPATEEDYERLSWWGGDIESPDDYWSLGDEEEKARQADLLREILANPYEAAKALPARVRSDTGVQILARQIYERYAFQLMPKLGQELQRAGCKQARWLEHCQQEASSHSRGCWLLDCLLDKQ